MINYHKNELINQCLQTFYATFAMTLDTADFVPVAYNKRILRYIFKNMRKAFKRIDREDRQYQKELAKKEKNGQNTGSTAADRSEDVTILMPNEAAGQESEPHNVVNDQRLQPEPGTLQNEVQNDEQ